MNHFPATRHEALQRLEEFLCTASRYGAVRNHVLPGHPNISRLSAAIRHRLITEEEMVGMALRRHSFREIEKWLQEVLWRGYWKGWLEVHPQVWTQYCEATKYLTSQMDSEQAARCHEISKGHSRSGIMNHFARELLETGYLHNHARMWWASYWIHHCELPWELGAEHFFHHLLDADPASNTLSWRWVAGRQTRGKAYVATNQNILKFCSPEILSQSGGVGFGDGEVSSGTWNGDSETQAIIEIPTFTTAIDCHDQHRIALLLHDEDFCLETGPAAGLQPTVVLPIIPEPESLLPAPREHWLALARADAYNRAGDHFRCGVQVCRSIENIEQACAAERIETVVMMEPFVGPLRDHLNGLREALLRQNIQCVRLRRQWDASLLPYASRGFFPFWKKVGRQLEKSGLEGLA